MATVTSQAAITYNTDAFLSDKLNALADSGTIREWYFIRHRGEWDEEKQSRDKDHVHMWFQPNRRIDLAEFHKLFREIDPRNPLPLQPLAFRPSKLYDALLYDMHYEPYLKLKYLEREFHYSLEDFHSSSADWLEMTFKEAISSDIFKSVRLADALARSDIGTLARNGQVPVNLSCQIKTFSELVHRGYKAAAAEAEKEASRASEDGTIRVAQPAILSPEERARLESRIASLEAEDERLHQRFLKEREYYKKRIVESDIAQDKGFIQLELSDETVDMSDKK